MVELYLEVSKKIKEFEVEKKRILDEIIKLADKTFEHYLIHTGQNYDHQLNEIFFKDLDLRNPDYFLNVVGSNLGVTIGNVISKSYDILTKLKPEDFSSH